MKTIVIKSPYDNHNIETILIDDMDSVNKKVEMVYKYFQDKSNWLLAYERKKILKTLAIKLRDVSNEFAILIAEEGGKPIKDARIEVERAINSIEMLPGLIDSLHGVQVPMDLSKYSSNKVAFNYPEPIGLVYVISAFNYPLNLIVHQAITAIASGCPVIIKPSSKTPLSCIKLIRLLYDSGLSKDWCQVVICENKNAEFLASDFRIKHLSFVGSSDIGWYLRSKLLPGVSCSLEHGGVAPVIITEDADLDEVIPAITYGAFYHAGQVCISVQRIYVHDQVIKEFNKKIINSIEKLVVGNPLHESTDIGPIISQSALMRIDEYVQESLYKDGKILIGGKVLENQCYSPTLIQNPNDNAQVSYREIFGPVACVFNYSDYEKAILHANKLPFYFQASVFSQNINRAMYISNRLSANTIVINDHSAFRADWMPFGGHGESGIGKGGLLNAMKEVTFKKLIVLGNGYIK